MFGFVVGGILTDNGMANHCFLIMLISTTLVNISSCFLDSSLEDDQKEFLEQPICFRFGNIYRQVKECVREKTLFRMFLFQVITGWMTPRFDDYMYQYYTEPNGAGFS